MQVEADSEEDAISKFYESATLDDIVEWECCEKIVEGNVFHGMQNEIDIEDI